ncbi:MAG: VOC family protein [Candidatus Hodarchaeota archaeon]
MNTNNITEIDFGTLKIDHICFIYKKAEKQAKIMETLFKMPKFSFSEVIDNPAIYRGKETEFSLKIGISRCFNTSIEIFQWLNGDGIYKEFVDANKEGLHHFGCYVDNLENYINHFQNKGIEVIQTGFFNFGKLHYMYLDTEKIFGTIIEILEIIKRKRSK